MPPLDSRLPADGQTDPLGQTTGKQKAKDDGECEEVVIH